MTGLEYFQCLLCKTFFPSLWKVERHIRQHNDGDGSPNEPRRRGMLPIKKAIFINCHIPLVRTKASSSFEFTNGGKSAHNSKSKVTKFKANTNGESSSVESSVRKPRISSLKAAEIIQRLSSKLLKNAGIDGERKKGDDEFSIDGVSSYDESDEDEEENDDEFQKVGKVKSKRGPGRPPKNPQEFRIKKKAKVKRVEKISCQYCTEKWGSQSALTRHLLLAHSDKRKQIPCFVPTCNQPFLTFFMLRRHVTLHKQAEEKESRYVDQSTTSDVDNLSADSSESEDDNVILYRKANNVLKKSFLCKICLRRFDAIVKLRGHIKKKHKELSPGLKCQYCETLNLSSTVKELIDHTFTNHRNEINPFGERAKPRGKRPPKILYKCDQCEKVSESYNGLEKHKKTHDPGFEEARKEDEKLRIYPCPACDKKFKYKDNLRRHYHLLHLPRKEFVCTFPDCKRKFSSEQSLRRHKQLHEENVEDRDRLKCPLCPGVYSGVKHLKRHLRCQHRPSDMTNPRKVRSTGMRKKQVFPVFQKRRIERLLFPNQPHDAHNTSTKVGESDVDTDVKTDGNNVKMEPGMCGGIVEEIHLNDKIKLDPDGNAKHIKGETLTPVSYTPGFLSSSANRSSAHHSLSSKDHHGERPGSILGNSDTRNPHEGENLSGVDVLGGRTNNYVADPGKLFRCSICNIDFSRAWSLQSHLLAAHNKTLLEETIASDSDKLTILCGTCAYLAMDGDDLKKHVKIKHSLKFGCPQYKCGCKFASQARLNRHIQEIHDTLKSKFECKFCKKKFGTKGGLKAHLNQVHPNSVAVPEKIPCKICKRLYKPSSMRTHLWHHKDAAKLAIGEKLERNHKCMLCNDTFATATSLKRHIDCIHLGKPYNKGRGKAKSERETQWYKPLLEKMGLGSKTPGNADNTDDGEGEVLSKEIDGENAILGF